MVYGWVASLNYICGELVLCAVKSIVLKHNMHKFNNLADSPYSCHAIVHGFCHEQCKLIATSLTLQGFDFCQTLRESVNKPFVRHTKNSSGSDIYIIVHEPAWSDRVPGESKMVAIAAHIL